ncbi:MAG: hypothetical protein A2X86_05375 [Bdellovibrionales bacterium GWA2_49_15]|nr:MAG: hypothetical protein A2X86_05375 [Bdellovibrionales bacterium GWA2_49_15]
MELRKLSKLLNIPLPKSIDEDELNRIFAVLERRHPTGEDPWGLNLRKSRESAKLGYSLYKHYFKTRVIGAHKVQDRPYMVVSNHSGQIAIDGMLITAAFILDIWPPRILRSMVERFVMTLPFFGSFAAANGAVLGDRSNCEHLLTREESILVFPEGVRGVSKSTNEFYKLQNFTQGFFRLCLKTKTDILPIATVGAEEFYPFVYQARGLARKLGLPALPLTPFFPTLGILGIVPLPSPVDILIGDPYPIPQDLSPDAPDKLINEHVYKIESIIRDLIAQGRSHRRKFWGTYLLPSVKGPHGPH